MGFLDDHCSFSPLNEELTQRCPPFSCKNDKDIEAFFANDYKLFAEQLFGKSYGFFTNGKTPHLVSAFTVSNSMLPIDRFPKSIQRRINKNVPFVKRRVQHPAVLIGQLAVFNGYNHLGVGDGTLDFIKIWFLSPENKTGCRYLIIDAVNHPKVIGFYVRNGFKFIFDRIEDEIEYMQLDLEPEYKRTRLMYFDLIVLKS